MKRILIINDDNSTDAMIADCLKTEDNFITVIGTDNLLNDRLFFDLVIINITGLPNYGWILCREIRKKSNIPIIVLTPKHEDIYELYGFEIGIDDYMRKPFNPQVLIARINRLFKRISKENKVMYTFDELKVDKYGHSVHVKGKPVNLRPKEYDLLLYLIENQGKAISRDQILADVWNYDYDGYQRTVDSHIKKIRKKLGNNRSFIQTIRNFGYKFVNSYV
ncbi:MAG: response regulator transcription factor [Spirochaetales bacterium]|nr:response regulator transcription factor [Spirochaetales bacterium]